MTQTVSKPAEKFPTYCAISFASFSIGEFICTKQVRKNEILDENFALSDTTKDMEIMKIKGKAQNLICKTNVNSSEFAMLGFFLTI